jgi:hypothetical protein
MSKNAVVWPFIDGYGSKSTNSDLAGFYLLLYIRQLAGLFRRRTFWPFHTLVFKNTAKSKEFQWRYAPYPLEVATSRRPEMDSDNFV